MRYAIHLALMLTFLSSTTSVLANAINPVQLNFDNNQQLTVTLSKTGINRVFVKDDQITSIAAPEADMSSRNDAQGSVYARILTPQPFTAFVVTAAGRHFSLLVLPKGIPSQTVELIANSPSAAEIKTAKSRVYEQRLIDIVRALLRGQTPKGMGIQKIEHAKPIDFQEGRLKTVMRFTGALMNAQVLRFQNTTAHPITLSANSFYHKGVLAVSLSKQTVMPQGNTEVVEVLKGEGIEDGGQGND